MAAAASPGAEPGQGATGGPPAAAAAGAVEAGGEPTAPMGESPASVTAGDRDPFDERPEAYVGAAFVGGFALAMILKRVAR
ncbi:MAG: hypothetical protein ICV69_12320 [Thermoleophilaceae bacterium]|nr:hypothetical protein [Thermoleophilaceae bacterium]